MLLYKGNKQQEDAKVVAESKPKCSLKMRLQADVLRYMTKGEFRVLTAVEMGMKNHEFVSSALIEQIAGLRRHSIRQILSTLLKNKLVFHSSKSYDGYKMTYLGYDYLALNAFVKRGLIKGVGVRVGVGKESDIHVCEGTDGKVLILKLHRLGEFLQRNERHAAREFNNWQQT